MEKNTLKHQTKKAVYWSFFNNIANQGTAFIFGIILARLLSPNDFGILAMPAVFSALANVFILSGFNTALIRKPEINEKDLSTAFIFNTTVGFICSLILFLASPSIATFYNQPILSNVLRVSSLTLFFGAFQSVHYVGFNRNLDFKTPAKISLSSNILTGVVGISLAYAGWGIWALVFQGIAGLIVSMILVWSYSKWRPRTGWSWESFKYLWGFGNKMLLSGLIDTIYDNIYPITIAKYLNTSQLGLFNRAQGYASLPHKQITGMVINISFPILSKLQNDKEKLNETFTRVIKLTTFVLCPVLLGLSALAEPIVITMLTDRWAGCISLLKILCIPVIFWPLQSLNLILLSVLGRSDLVLRLNVFIKITGVIITAFGIYSALRLHYGIIAMGWAMCLHTAIAIPVAIIFNGKLTQMGLQKQIKEILPVLLLGTFMFIIINITNNLLTNNIAKIFIGTTLGMLIYIGGAYLCNFSQIKDLRFLLRKH